MYWCEAHCSLDTREPLSYNKWGRREALDVAALWPRLSLRDALPASVAPAALMRPTPVLPCHEARHSNVVVPDSGYHTRPVGDRAVPRAVVTRVLSQRTRRIEWQSVTPPHA